MIQTTKSLMNLLMKIQISINVVKGKDERNSKTKT